MSSMPAMSRPQAGAEEFERHLRGSGLPAPEGNLAELQRLVGGKDPFKGVFPVAAPSAARPRTEPVFAPVTEPEADIPADYHQAGFEPHEGGFNLADDDVFAALEREFRGSIEEPVHAPAREGHDYEAHPDAELSPDAWAEQEEVAEEPFAQSPPPPPAAVAAPAPAMSSGRTLIVLAAVMVLTGGGLAASFLARPSGAAANVMTANGDGPPTILAVPGPSKVQPPASANGTDGTNEPSTLLDKNHDDGTARAKVVNNIEQPVDLAQAVKSTASRADVTSSLPPDAASGTGATPSAVLPVPPNPFPEPRKVKTVVVRPDGTFVANGEAASAPAASPDLTAASLAFDSHTAIPMSGDANATPQPDADAPAAPRPSASANAGGANASPDATPAPAPAAPHVRPKPKPVQQAALDPAPDAPAPNAAGGGYAVQLGAPSSPQEAREAAARLQKKFGDALGSYRPSVHEGKSGDKTVYRIRVVNLSQADARALCAKLQSSGGACFVVHN